MNANFQFFDSKLRQRATSQYKVNANDLCTKELSRSCQFRICIIHVYTGRP